MVHSDTSRSFLLRLLPGGHKLKLGVVTCLVCLSVRLILISSGGLWYMRGDSLYMSRLDPGGLFVSADATLRQHKTPEVCIGNGGTGEGGGERGMYKIIPAAPPAPIVLYQLRPSLFHGTSSRKVLTYEDAFT